MLAGNTAERSKWLCAPVDVEFAWSAVQTIDPKEQADILTGEAFERTGRY
jgi:hypothetical protein